MYKQIATFFALIASAMAFVPEPVAKGKLSGEDPPSIDRGWAENGIGARDVTTPHRRYWGLLQSRAAITYM